MDNLRRFNQLDSRAQGLTRVTVLMIGCLALECFTIVLTFQPGEEDDYVPTRRILTYLVIMACIACTLTMGIMVKCILNFGQGLKPLLTATSQGWDQREQQMDLVPIQPREQLRSRYTYTHVDGSSAEN